MRDGPLVSVIVPVHNGGRFLAAALSSIHEQDHDPVEVIVIDDGSTDESLEIARSFPDTACISQEQAGPAAARNAGIRRATGDLISFLDVDDILHPEKLSRQVSFLERQPEATGVVCLQEVVVDPGVAPPDWILESADEDVAGDPLRAIFLSKAQPLSVMVRAEVLEQVGMFDEAYWMGEDVELILRIEEATAGLRLLPETLMVRRMHGANMTYRYDWRDRPLLQLMHSRIRRQRASGEAER